MRARPTLGPKPPTPQPKAPAPPSETHHGDWDAGRVIEWDVWGQHRELGGLVHMDGHDIKARNAQKAREIFEQRNPKYQYLFACPRHRVDKDTLKWPGLSWLPNWMALRAEKI